MTRFLSALFSHSRPNAALAGVALPEEQPFRPLIQNWLMQRFDATHRTLFGAASLHARVRHTFFG
jgi:hypothetical protein